MLTAHNLAGDWTLFDGRGFRLRGGRVVWESAQYGRGDKVRISRLIPLGRVEDGLLVAVRYVDPATPVEVVA